MWINGAEFLIFKWVSRLVDELFGFVFGMRFRVNEVLMTLNPSGG